MDSVTETSGPSAEKVAREITTSIFEAECPHTLPEGGEGMCRDCIPGLLLSALLSVEDQVRRETVQECVRIIREEFAGGEDSVRDGELTVEAIYRRFPAYAPGEKS